MQTLGNFVYSLLPKPQPISALGCWAPDLPAFTHVVGYSGLGHFFLWNAATSEYAVLYPYRRASKGYGAHQSLRAFELAVLLEVGFAEYVLRPKHQQEICNLLGVLDQAQVYIARPYPFLGGSEAPETYMKGNVWVFAELVGQAHGLKPVA